MKARRSIAIGARIKSGVARTRRGLALCSRAMLFWRKGARVPATPGKPTPMTTIRQGDRLSWRIGICIVHRHPLRALTVPIAHSTAAAYARHSPVAAPFAVHTVSPSPLQRRVQVALAWSGKRHLENSVRVRREGDRSTSAVPSSGSAPTNALSVRRPVLHVAAQSLRRRERAVFQDTSDHPVPRRAGPPVWNAAVAQPAPLATRTQALVWSPSAHATRNAGYTHQGASFSGAAQPTAVTPSSTACTPAEVEAIASRQMRAARPATETWDSGAADRIASEVMRRVEKNLRIERERRGR